MRTGNLVVTALGLGATAVAATIAWYWRNLPTHPVRRRGDGWRGSALDSLRTFAATITAGAVTGVLVLGCGGRLVMRVLAATSGSGAQGRLTEAGERVGAITTDGTLGFLTFVGLGGGVIVSLAYVIVRSLLPDNAGRAGLTTGIIATGTIGVADPLSPGNVDFALLSPLPLAIVLLVLTALLFTTAFAALAARFEQISASSASLPRRLPTMAALPLLLLVPPFAIGCVVFVGLRSAFIQSTDHVGATWWLRVAARASVTVAVVVTAAVSTRAVVQIL